MRHQTVGRNFLNGFWRGIDTALINMIVIVWVSLALIVTGAITISLVISLLAWGGAQRTAIPSEIEEPGAGRHPAGLDSFLEKKNAFLRCHEMRALVKPWT
jgi:hypothetical protein